MTANINYTLPASQGVANTVLKNDGSGGLSWGAQYSENIQYVEGTTDISINSTTFTDMTNMTITFTPIHNYVYLHFSASGDAANTYDTQAFVEFNILKDGTALTSGGVVSIAHISFDAASGTNTEFSAWNCYTVRRISVTAGTSTTIKIQWAKAGLSPDAIYNNVGTAGSKVYSHRSMMIID